MVEHFTLDSFVDTLAPRPDDALSSYANTTTTSVRRQVSISAMPVRCKRTKAQPYGGLENGFLLWQQGCVQLDFAEHLRSGDTRFARKDDHIHQSQHGGNDTDDDKRRRIALHLSCFFVESRF